MFFETPAAVHQLTKRHCPRNVAFIEQRCPGTLGAPVTLHKPQRTNERHHGAFLYLNQHEPIFAFRLTCFSGSVRAFLIAPEWEQQLWPGTLKLFAGTRSLL